MKAQIKSKLTAGFLTAIFASIFFCLNIAASEQNIKRTPSKTPQRKIAKIIKMEKLHRDHQRVDPPPAAGNFQNPDRVTAPQTNQDNGRKEELKELLRLEKERKDEINRLEAKIKNLTKKPEISNGEFYRSRRQELQKLSELKSQLCDIQLRIIKIKKG